MKLSSKNICQDCVYFNSDISVCQMDTTYQEIDKFNQACSMFASDDDEIINNPTDYHIDDLYDEENDFTGLCYWNIHKVNIL